MEVRHDAAALVERSGRRAAIPHHASGPGVQLLLPYGEGGGPTPLGEALARQGRALHREQIVQIEL